MRIPRLNGQDNKKRLFGKIALVFMLFLFGILSMIFAYGIMVELNIIELLDKKTLPEGYTKEEVASKIGYLIIELIFVIVLIRYAIIILYSLFYKSRITNSKERRLADFQSRFTLQTLIIAITISFFIQSLNDDRLLWAGVWALLAVAGFAYLTIYRNKKLREIFDDDHDIIR